MRLVCSAGSPVKRASSGLQASIVVQNITMLQDHVGVLLRFCLRVVPHIFSEIHCKMWDGMVLEYGWLRRMAET